MREFDSSDVLIVFMSLSMMLVVLPVVLDCRLTVAKRAVVTELHGKCQLWTKESETITLTVQLLG